MGAIIGLKDNFLKGREDLKEMVFSLKREGKNWNEIEEFLREEFKGELSFLRPNLFTYFLFIGGIFLLPLLYLWKSVFEPETFGYFISRLLFAISAMLSLKGIVGHYVVVFLNRDRFEAELQALKATIEGGKNGSGKQSN
ncbi:MAG: hypothetical protein DSZ26_02875 [Thermovibrio sp.]|nr:MAG: hypothetical protein DSZ26_02875 [Thermovibrio sp.]